MSVSRHQSPSSNRNGVHPQDADTLRMLGLSPVVYSSAAQLTRDHHNDAVTAVLDPTISRDTGQLLGDGHDAAERQTSQDPELLTSSWPAGGRQDDCLPSEGIPTWRAHHQDFYDSKWFKSLQISIIATVIIVAFLVFLFVSFFTDDDFFAPEWM